MTNTISITPDLLANILASLPKNTQVYNSFTKIAGSLQNATNGLNGGYYYSGLGAYSNINEYDSFQSDGLGYYVDQNGLGFSFKSIGNFISRNVQSAGRDAVKVIKVAAPLLSMAASFLPGGSLISGIVDKVIAGGQEQQQPQQEQQQPVQQSAQPFQNVNQFGFPNTGTYTTPSQQPFIYNPVGFKNYQPTQQPIQLTEPQVQSLASIKNVEFDSLKQELENLKEKSSTKSEIKKPFEITTPIAIGGALGVGLIVYLIAKK